MMSASVPPSSKTTMEKKKKKILSAGHTANTAIKLDHKADSLPRHDLLNKKRSAPYFTPTVILKVVPHSPPESIRVSFHV